MAKKNLIKIEDLLVERGHAPSVERARALILAGSVMMGTVRVSSGAQKVEPGEEIAVRAPAQFVSRGGLKLDRALSDFGIAVSGKMCADIGAATGGFSDAMLQRGAEKVYAVDVGYGDLHWKVRSNPRVIPIERTNARVLEALPESVSLIAVDVSFISVTALFDNFFRWLDAQGDVIALIKPQFEADQDEADKGEGVVTDPAIHRRVIQRVGDEAIRAGFTTLGLIFSPIEGTYGNREFLIWLKKGDNGAGKPIIELIEALFGDSL